LICVCASATYYFIFVCKGTKTNTRSCSQFVWGIVFQLHNTKLQQQLAQAQASAKAKNAESTVQNDAQRLVAAERSMQTQLDKVAQETAEVERAVADLRAAQEELNKDLGSKLRAGGLPKQGALAGLLLFGVRSILDSLTAVSTGDPAALTAALVQGAIAVVCAIAFFFL